MIKMIYYSKKSPKDRKAIKFVLQKCLYKIFFKYAYNEKLIYIAQIAQKGTKKELSV